MQADPQSEPEDEELPEINPKQSLFDDHISPDVATNIEYMYQKYGFFIPDREFLIDPEGLIGYCAKKSRLVIRAPCTVRGSFGLGGGVRGIW
jgi:pre-60S factor REI1